MHPEPIKNKRLFCLFLLGCLIFNFPIISLFNYEIFIFGIPLLFVFLFFAWGMLILAMVFITRINTKKHNKIIEKKKSYIKKPDFPYPSDQGPEC
jgi:hypothetical protein